VKVSELEKDNKVKVTLMTGSCAIKVSYTLQIFLALLLLFTYHIVSLSHESTPSLKPIIVFSVHKLH